jgi:hypothetical protein
MRGNYRTPGCRYCLADGMVFSSEEISLLMRSTSHSKNEDGEIVFRIPRQGLCKLTNGIPLEICHHSGNEASCSLHNNNDLCGLDFAKGMGRRVRRSW